MKTVKVLLMPKCKMKDKKGRKWMGMNPGSTKANQFRTIRAIEVQESLPKNIREATERHEYIEWQAEKKGASYKTAHKKALKKEKKQLKDIRFKEIKRKR